MKNTNSKSTETERSSSAWPLLVLLVIAAATLWVIQMRRPERVSQWVDRALPPLEVAGWLNAAGPLSTDDLRGQVVLVDFWRSDCGPCLRHMPELVAFHERFRDQGVVMVGLTPERQDAVEQVQHVIRRAEIKWPIGYGAGLAFNALEVYGTPTYLLYDRTGRCVWDGHSLHGLEEATLAALAR